MAIPTKSLSPGEKVILHTHTHWKVLILPIIAFIATCIVAGYLISILPSGSLHTPLLVLILVLALAEAIGYTLRAFVLWISASYTLTNRRLINRNGILVKRGRDIPLQRINQVSYERGVVDRMFGCGTLVIADASEEGSSVLTDVPNVEDVQVTINNMVFGTYDGSDDDGTPRSALPPVT